MSITEQLARHIAATSYESIPSEAVEAAKIVILDGLAVTIAGSSETAAQLVSEYAREMGGNPMCSVFGQGFKTSPPMAAFVNGVAGHVLDYEVMWHPATHATSPTLPGILAMAENRGATGQDIVAALITGFEVQGRIRVASADMALGGFHPPGLVGVMGSAAAASVMLRLDVQQTRMALGIAASRAGTVSANTGSMTKSTHCGNAGRMGLEAALLAAKGFTANANVIEHETGYAAVLFGEDFDLEFVTRNFGNPYRLVDPGVAIKKHPSQYGTHRGIDAALELQERYNIDPGHIAAIRIETPVMRYVGRPYPETGLDGKFSFQYTVAASLLDRRIGIDTFTDEAVHRPEVLALLSKTTVEMKPEIPANFEDMWVTVRVDTVEGQTYGTNCVRPRGIWGNPLTRDERLAKVRSCANRVRTDAETERIIEIVENLENADSTDIQELVDVLGRESTSQQDC